MRHILADATVAGCAKVVVAALAAHAALDALSGFAHHSLRHAALGACHLIAPQELRRALVLHRRAGRCKHGVSKRVNQCSGRDYDNIPIPGVGYSQHAFGYVSYGDLEKRFGQRPAALQGRGPAQAPRALSWPTPAGGSQRHLHQSEIEAAVAEHGELGSKGAEGPTAVPTSSTGRTGPWAATRPADSCVFSGGACPGAWEARPGHGSALVSSAEPCTTGASAAGPALPTGSAAAGHAVSRGGWPSVPGPPAEAGQARRVGGSGLDGGLYGRAPADKRGGSGELVPA